MTTKERILSLRILDSKRKNPNYLEQLNVSAEMQDKKPHKEAAYEKRIC